MAIIFRLFGIITAWYVFAVLILSSLFVNILQALSLLLLLFPYKNRLDYSQQLANTWWELFCFIMECWAGLDYVWTGDTVKAENAILLGNHERGMDFVNGIVVVSRVPEIRCGRMMVLMKSSLQYVPTVGFTHYLQGSLFLKRNWEKDHKNLTSKLSDMESGLWPEPFWVGVYPEGTRITDKKRIQSHAFAEKNGLPKLNNVLLPRTKGFTFLLENLPSKLNAIYDVCIGYGKSPLYISDALFGGGFRSTGIHIHINRIDISSLPSDEKGRSEWLIKRFEEKDRLLQHFKDHGEFPGVKRSNEDSKWKERRQRFISLFLIWATIVNIALYAVSCSIPTIVIAFLLLGLTLLVTQMRLNKAQSKQSKTKAQ